MDIGFRHVWQLVIDDMGDAIDIDAARGDVACHQHLGPAVAKIGDGALARTLRLVAVDGIGVNAPTRELLGNAVGAMLDARKQTALSRNSINTC
jgi:hypothetical protein